MKSIPEPDWKVLRELAPALRDRYCERAMTEIARAASEGEGSAHERYLTLYELVRKSDKRLGRAFDDLRRSNALLKLALMHAYGLLTPEEFRRFGAETRSVVQGVVDSK